MIGTPTWFWIRYTVVFLSALVILLAFGLLGLMAMGGGMNGQSPSVIGFLLGLGAIVLAAMPMGWALSLGNAHWSNGNWSHGKKLFGMGIGILALVFGFYSLVEDPGDFLWSGLPLLAFGSATISLAMEGP